MPSSNAFVPTHKSIEACFLFLARRGGSKVLRNATTTENHRRGCTTETPLYGKSEHLEHEWLSFNVVAKQLWRN